ncbi:cyclin-O [Nothobranchius furzeri]|uniref:G2/mitotic-specific cyclin-B2 n=2 Tax=Nothobranchius furzeri TaxID=105023 RepID=A0A9D2XEI5_NOTFU|nr:cyclin O [Nothobranchius furzeri]
MTKLCDSGFEEDLVSSPVLSRRTRADASHPGSEETEPAARQLCNWYLQYGDVGFKIQKEKELLFHPCKSLARQPQLTPDARCKLVSWLIPIHKHFRLSFECSCLTVNIMDRFLASTPIAADCFQLLGVAALLLACKQVEVCSPSVSHLLSLCCDAFTKEQFFNLECLILLRLNFRLSAPTLAFFLNYFTNCIDARLVMKNNSNKSVLKENSGAAKTKPCRNLAQKMCELTLADYAFNKYPPSLTACCALITACELLKTERTTLQLQETHLDTHSAQLVSVQESSACPEADSLGEMEHFLFPDEGGYSYTLVQECKSNLKLLVSLNLGTLEWMSAM